MTRERQELGRAGEAAAAKFLRRKGYRIVARNAVMDSGELDIVARRRNLIVFVEVKTRISDQHAHPMDNITYSKKRHVIASAKEYLRKNKLTDKEYRFDVIAIVWGTGKRPERIEHHPDAFAESRR